jgi:hypothetical protein
MNLFLQKGFARPVGYCAEYGPDVLRSGLMTALLVILGIACAWAAITVVAVGLCVLAARGDRTLRAGIGEPAGRPRPSSRGNRLRAIA